jgi:signal transduction histidine kinase
VRVRVTLAAVLVVGFALVTGALVLVALLGSVLTDQVCRAAQDRAVQLAATPAAVLEPSSTESVQVIDRAGQVNGGGSRLASPGAGCVRVEPPGHGEDFVFAAAVVPSGGEVVVGRPLVDVLDSTSFVRRVLVVGVPLMMLVVAGVTWVVTGRVLAPVTAIRREVDAITAAELHRRVPAARADEIGRLARTMNRMLERLHQAQQSQHRFVSDASHELRSPIAAIRQHAEVALAHPERTGVGERAATVLAEDLRMQHLIDDLLVLARSDEQRSAPPDLPVDLDDLVLAEAKTLRAATSMAVDTMGVSGGQVCGDGAELARMVHNLGGNAARHARTGIVFGVAESDGVVVLTVSDDGPGIPAADRERVFERFVRLDAARARDTGGAGLGLSIAAGIVNRHRGTIRVTGRSTFEVRLPAVSACSNSGRSAAEG